MQFLVELHLIILKSYVFNCTFYIVHYTLVIDLNRILELCYAKPDEGGG